MESRARIVEIWDRRSAASIVTEAETRDENGQLLFTNRFSLFLRGEGGFGGKPGPRRVNRAPRREPDLVVHTPTATHLSLLYRLSGDKNPLHADPEFARRAGFEAPILHGLCSYGVVCKAAVDAALDGEVAAVAAYAARFSGAAFPGETIVTSIWREDGRLLISAKTQERSSPVLSDAALDLR